MNWTGREVLDKLKPQTLGYQNFCPKHNDPHSKLQSLQQEEGQ